MTRADRPDPARGGARPPRASNGSWDRGRGPRLIEAAADRIGADTVKGFLLKVILLVAVNGLALSYLPRLIDDRAWSFVVILVAATVAIDVVYLSRRRLPAKYLLPGTLFLLAFQVYPVLYNTFVAFTNYGTGHLLTQEQAVEVIQARSLTTPPDAVRYTARALEGPDGTPALYLVDPDGNQFVGTADGMVPAAEVGDITGEPTAPQTVGDYRALSLGAVQARQQEFLELRVPSETGEIQLTSLTAAAQREPLLVYDDDAGTMRNTQTDAVYRPNDRGQFVSDEGEALVPGWRVTVGMANFRELFSDPTIRGPAIRVFVWTYAFAALSVLFTFALGLLLAVTLSDSRLRSQRFYRTVMIIPYALPSFLTALIWAGLLNTEFGAVNRLFDASIPWLTDPTWAKASVLLVNTWLGFPYMFLICTGALTSIPGELVEAAKVDGATALQAFRRVTFPLLLVTTAPLLIASFAFNFNNFNIIYLLTRGNPPIEGAQTPAGHTDILISYTYRVAFAAGGGSRLGFAAAISVIIFILVASVSAYSFRFTRALEDIN